MLPEGIENQARARQYMLDFYEWFNQLGDLLKNEISVGFKSPAYFHKYMTKTLPMYLSLAEKQIQGPYFFGHKPCYIDYFVVGIMQMFRSTAKPTIEAGVYPDPFKAHKKLSAIYNDLAPKGDRAIAKRYPKLDIFVEKFQIPAILGKAAKPTGVLIRPVTHIFTSLNGGHKGYVLTLLATAGSLAFLSANLYFQWV